MMRSIKTFLATAILLGLVMAAAAHAAPAPGSGSQTMVIPITGTFTSTSTGVVSFVAPMGYQIQSASVSAQTVSGTNPTMKVRIKNGTFTNISGTTTAAATPTTLTRVFTSATASGVTVSVPPRMTAGSTQSVDLVLGGTSPSFANITLTLLLKPY